MSGGPPASSEVRELEQRIEALRREYDHFLAGVRRTEPEKLRRDLERELRRLVGSPLLTTAERFRVTTLAHRFRALETRVRNLLERRQARGTQAGEEARGGAEIVVDRVLLHNPAALERYVGRLHREISRAAGGRAPVSVETLRERIVAAVGAHLGREGVEGVRFRVEVSDGRPRVKGDVLVRKDRPGGKGGASLA